MLGAPDVAHRGVGRGLDHCISVAAPGESIPPRPGCHAFTVKLCFRGVKVAKSLDVNIPGMLVTLRSLNNSCRSLFGFTDHEIASWFWKNLHEHTNPGRASHGLGSEDASELGLSLLSSPFFVRLEMVDPLRS